MPRKQTAAVKKRKATPGAYKLAAPLPPGEVLSDYCKKQWKLGKPIGIGGFGCIYLTDQNSSAPVSENASYALKLEPHENGPLFCELHFYQRVAKPETIQEWKEKKKLKHLSIPRFIASGNHMYQGVQYRFMVMDRCGTDLQKVFENNHKQFPEKTVYLLGIKLLNALEYIHEKEYVHADIKASNIMTGFGKEKAKEVYLVDYGLAFRYTADGQHKQYKEDPKRQHDGTVEFTSRDAHRGVAPSRRGDLEILGYCMLQWLCKALPWEDNLGDKDYVKNSKIKYMDNITALMKKCLPGTQHDELKKYLEYVANLKYDERPNYDKCLSWFRQALKRFGSSESDKLIFAVSEDIPTQKPVAQGRKQKMNGQGDQHSKPNCAENDMSDIKSPRQKRASQEHVKKPRPSKRKNSMQNPTSKMTSPKKRVDSEGKLIPMPAVPPPSSANDKKVQSLKRKATASTATQTSPGLKGLPRSCKKTRY